MIGWVVDIDFITILLMLNNNRFVFFHFILNCVDNFTFDLYVSYMSFIIFFSQVLNKWYVFISVTLFKAVKELHKVPFPILMNTSIEKYKIRIINFGIIINLHLLFVGKQVIQKTLQCVSTIKSKIYSSIIFKNSFNLSSHCQQVSTRREGWYQKFSIFLLYSGGS